MSETNDNATSETSATQAPTSLLPAKAQTQKRGLAHIMLNQAKARWRKIRLATKGIMRAKLLAASDKQEFQQDSKQALNEALTGASDVKLQASDMRDLQSINYMKQGDAELYSEDMLQKRHSMRHEPLVVRAIQEWWSFVPKSATQDTQTDVTAPMTYISKESYCALVIIIQLVLLPRFKMEPDLNYDPEEDWENDSKGKAMMDYPDFFDAMFELADLWCPSVSPEEYSKLLNELLADARKHKWASPSPPPLKLSTHLSVSPPSTPPAAKPSTPPQKPATPPKPINMSYKPPKAVAPKATTQSVGPNIRQSTRKTHTAVKAQPRVKSPGRSRSPPFDTKRPEEHIWDVRLPQRHLDRPSILPDAPMTVSMAEVPHLHPASFKMASKWYRMYVKKMLDRYKDIGGIPIHRSENTTAYQAVKATSSVNSYAPPPEVKQVDVNVGTESNKEPSACIAVTGGHILSPLENIRPLALEKSNQALPVNTAGKIEADRVSGEITQGARDGSMLAAEGVGVEIVPGLEPVTKDGCIQVAEVSFSSNDLNLFPNLDPLHAFGSASTQPWDVSRAPSLELSFFPKVTGAVSSEFSSTSIMSIGSEDNPKLSVIPSLKAMQPSATDPIVVKAEATTKVMHPRPTSKPGSPKQPAPKTPTPHSQGGGSGRSSPPRSPNDKSSRVSSSPSRPRSPSSPHGISSEIKRARGAMSPSKSERPPRIPVTSVELIPPTDLPLVRMRQLKPMSITCHGFMQVIELQTSTKATSEKLISAPASAQQDLPDFDLQSLHHKLENLEGLIWLKESKLYKAPTSPRPLNPVLQLLDLRVSSNGLTTLNRRLPIRVQLPHERLPRPGSPSPSSSPPRTRRSSPTQSPRSRAPAGGLFTSLTLPTLVTSSTAYKSSDAIDSNKVTASGWINPVEGTTVSSQNNPAPHHDSLPQQISTSSGSGTFVKTEASEALKGSHLDDVHRVQAGQDKEVLTLSGRTRRIIWETSTMAPKGKKLSSLMIMPKKKQVMSKARADGSSA
ncbi:hypothetical protein CEUSTIGMA_g2186.t1 [Chlamydomonas eustigma]|uniref:Uncharacterized protein n=1 Tax=Chlamydomonas eustigma TaxID=1157962 RepID=A0A250WVK6_9CHLO|nr:hypothetical protein CEUSTIGMA_g2186.t1 [Chlamydomonas eustigma]|eukprot:GAX74739.1 hypothetical protein CEUSTIGMA_g2186.t1 [Chlamydomonas eustigma]